MADQVPVESLAGRGEVARFQRRPNRFGGAGQAPDRDRGLENQALGQQ